MKTPTARKLPSGSWFVRVQVDGQSINITKSTKKEAEAEAIAVKTGFIDHSSASRTKTLSSAIDDYIDARRNILSPATIRGYINIKSNRFQSLMKKDISKITQEQCQKAVNLEAKTISAKTLMNSWRFISSVISDETGTRLNIRLPQVIPAQRPWLTPDQIPLFVNAVKGDVAEIPALLALSSLRRSEIIGLRWCDVDLEHGILTVCGAAVPDEHHKIVYKQETKNRTSRRQVPIIPPLMEALKNAKHHGEYVVTCHPSTAMEQVNRVCQRANLPHVGLHGLRHSFASLAYHLRMPEKVAMEIGGWADNQTMHNIYTHIAQSELNSAAKSFTDFFGNCNENCNKK